MKYLLTTMSLIFCLSISTDAKAYNEVVVSLDSDTSSIALILKKNALLDDEHCEVPCGIYGDSLRIALIDEHIRTVEKASNKIIALSAEESPNYNQLIRWVMNKEKHAEEIQHIVSQYFLHQRIKIADSSDKKKNKRYTIQLKTLHKILVYSMKAKQGNDAGNIANLKSAVESFEEVYFHKH